MPLLGFTTNPMQIRIGRKVITVRKRAKDDRWKKLRLGDPLFLYENPRSPQMQKLFHNARPCAYKAGPLLRCQFTEALAICDGFESLNDMCHWFQKTHKQYLTHGAGEFFIIGWLHPNPNLTHNFPYLPNMQVLAGTRYEVVGS